MKNLDQLPIVCEKLFNDVLNGLNGGTYNLTNGTKFEASNGYFVGVSGFQVPKTYFLNAKYPINTLVVAILETSGLVDFDLIGSWVSNETVYIDGVYHIQDLNEAISLAEDCNQLAIWDIENSCEIKIKS